MRLSAVGALAIAGVAVGCRERPADDEFVVFAAASLRDALGEIGVNHERGSGTHVTFSFGPSNFLAQQLVAAPRADMFVSASSEWMDAVERAERLVPGTRRALVGNRLVVIANARGTFAAKSAEDLASATYEHLVLADPSGVPAGQYAKQWLESRGVWARVEGRVRPALDVRAALALVEEKRDAIGIVYTTDAAMSKKVRVLFEVPRAEAPAIEYPAALVARDRGPERARPFYDFLFGEEASRVFERHGFTRVGTSP